MIYNTFKEKNLSRLGFGTMRLPVSPDGKIDEKQVEEMVDYAIKNGINYFDTAYPYHGGMSETVIGKALKKYKRQSYYLATKYPGHQISSSYNPKEIFEEQLEKCGVEYFDFYLLHNVYENSIKTYNDSRWGIIDYFKEQKNLGRIKHLGFSTHADCELIESFVDEYADIMEFCQIQMNYLDWDLQNAKAKYEMLTRKNIPVWVMEPIRGGALAKLSEENEKLLKSFRFDESIASWALRYLLGLGNVKMILSGMSDINQMKDNVKTFSTDKPLSKEENDALFKIAEGMHNSVPCTACRYCTDGCPLKLNIPTLISIYNDIMFNPTTNAGMRIEALEENKKPSACIGCGACKKICPQKIDIPSVMKKLDEKLKDIPKWTDISKQREEAAKKLKDNKNQ